MNIYFRELKAHRKSLLFWSIGILFLEYASMNKYSGFHKAGDITKVFAAFPKGLAAAFGISSVDINSAIGWFTMAIMYTAVMLAIHASLLGAGILAKEEQDKTAEFLFSKPISRARAITEKLLAALTLVFALNIVTLLSSISSVAAFNTGASVNKEISLMMGELFVIQLIFLGIGAAVAGIIKKPKRAGATASAIMFLTFFISLWLDITDKLPWLKYFTPFKYFDPKAIVNKAKIDLVFIPLSLAIIAATIAATYYFYRTRDLHI